MQFSETIRLFLSVARWVAFRPVSPRERRNSLRGISSHLFRNWHLRWDWHLLWDWQRLPTRRALNIERASQSCVPPRDLAPQARPKPQAKTKESVDTVQWIASQASALARNAALGATQSPRRQPPPLGHNLCCQVPGAPRFFGPYPFGTRVLRLVVVVLALSSSHVSAAPGDDSNAGRKPAATPQLAGASRHDGAAPPQATPADNPLLGTKPPSSLTPSSPASSPSSNATTGESSPDIDHSVLRAIVRVRSSEGSCLTAAHLGKGRFVTALHGIDSLCPGNTCDSVVLEQKEEESKDAPSRTDHMRSVCQGAVAVLRRLPSIDLALLECQLISPDLPLLRLSPATVSLQERVSLLSYPLCGELAVDHGAVTTRSPLTFVASTRGNRGSSGGAIIDANQEIIGVAVVAGNLLDGTINYVTGRNFPMKAAASAHLQPLVAAATPQEVHAAEVRLLTRYYAQDVIPLRSFGRLFNGLEVAHRMQQVLTTAAQAPGVTTTTLSSALGAYQEPQAAMTLLGRPLGQQEQTESAFEMGAILVQIERYGVRENAAAPPNASWLNEAIKAADRPSADQRLLLDITSRLANEGYLGSQLMERVAIGSAALVAIFVATLWGLSIGLTWAWLLPRGVYYRIWVTSIVALLWPLSFVVFLVRERLAENKRKRSRRSSR